MGLKTYDAAKHVATLGPFPISGFGEGTMITVAPNQAERWNLQKGVQGASSRARNHDRSARTTFSLQQTSASNDILSALEKTGEALPLLIKDLSGRSVFVGPDSYVLGEPEASYGDSITNRDWVIETPDMFSHHGGN